ncbi:MAG: pyridoxine 5'-phosphate synthase [Candidatus Saganbacteria bacterium]|nr:pyridoxine 5'-phosphate synthase [Candidatus Saganbacteria bacterium]
MRLGVNVDHIATLREARKESFPDPLYAAKEAIAGGAQGIVCHLREDRRHIKDADVFRLRKLAVRLDLEMAATMDMLKFALKLKPHMVTIVPEKRREITTEGGLEVNSKVKNLSREYRGSKNSKLRYIIEKLQSRGVIVSLFVDPEPKQIKASAEIGAEFVEIHTGRYANASYLKGKRRTLSRELSQIASAAKLAKSLGLRVNAGHGLDYNNVRAIVRIPEIEELNIGYSIVARAVFVGMKKAVRDMRRKMR